MKKTTLLFLAVSSFLFSRSEVEIIGLRVYGNADEYNPPIIRKHEMISIDFEVTTVHPPNLQIVFKHASQGWIVDENLFVNEPSTVMTDYLAYSVAPNAVYRYTYSYRNSFPNSRNRVAFTYSGNYRFFIVDHDENDQVLAEGKFIVTEELVTTSMAIQNKYHTESNAPLNQVELITVTVNSPGEYIADDPNGIYHPDLRTVDIIQNWRILQPFRIDLDDRSGETFVEDFNKPAKKFWIRNVPAGNEYRRLDLSNATKYPNHQLAVLKDGPDLSRFQWPGKPDANGASKLRPFVGANSDYLEVELHLRLASPPAKKIYIAGGFNNWDVLPEYEMTLDTSTSLYIFRFWIRRGVYDYQYVLGDEDAEGRIVNQDWMTLEGNDWRTINRYTALVYYRDRRYGGFDRIVGFVRGRSPGGDNENIRSTQNPSPPEPFHLPGRPRPSPRPALPDGSKRYD